MYSSRSSCRFIKNQDFKAAAQELGTQHDCPWDYVLSDKYVISPRRISINTKITRYDSPESYGRAKIDDDRHVLLVKYQDEYGGIPDRHHDLSIFLLADKAPGFFRKPSLFSVEFWEVERYHYYAENDPNVEMYGEPSGWHRGTRYLGTSNLIIESKDQFRFQFEQNSGVLKFL